MVLARLTVRRVHSDEELEQFSAGFAEVVKVRSAGRLAGAVSLSYLKAARVTAVFDRSRRMVAGYVIGTKPPLRLVELVPTEARGRIVLPEGASWEECCEMTCFWKRPEIPSSFMLTRFWPRAIVDASRAGKRFVLGHTQSERVDAHYDQTRMGVTLYVGPSVNDLPSRLTLYDARHLIRDAFWLIAVDAGRRLKRRLA